MQRVFVGFTSGLWSPEAHFSRTIEMRETNSFGFWECFPVVAVSERVKEICSGPHMRASIHPQEYSPYIHIWPNIMQRHHQKLKQNMKTYLTQTEDTSTFILSFSEELDGFLLEEQVDFTSDVSQHNLIFPCFHRIPRSSLIKSSDSHLLLSVSEEDKNQKIQFKAH